MVDYISLKSKTKSGQFKVNKIHNYRYLIRVLWKLDHLGLIWINESTNNFISLDCSK